MTQRNQTKKSEEKKTTHLHRFVEIKLSDLVEWTTSLEYAMRLWDDEKAHTRSINSQTKKKPTKEMSNFDSVHSAFWLRIQLNLLRRTFNEARIHDAWILNQTSNYSTNQKWSPVSHSKSKMLTTKSKKNGVTINITRKLGLIERFRRCYNFTGSRKVFRCYYSPFFLFYDNTLLHWASERERKKCEYHFFGGCFFVCVHRLNSTE